VKILLDEGVPKIIQKRLSGLSIFTIEERGWRAVENGALLDLMAEEFAVLITTDKNISHQQNLKRRSISIISCRITVFRSSLTCCRKLRKR
jgi:hypothetical protein